ncbi:uncharacterized protein JN550_003055 [Neoarthrinium moseri]|uniref:uncharacterized protein n=1 Tax=Neoarthrinium moseri TaxID=1658444 RepID=UPI001FDAE270|nr:uncharacterized protein JN550_003055 [Neoarthrinium moseri]KAI1873786.1 hypothetical protein JN550_003055 [Neoarthrinium moseri]
MLAPYAILFTSISKVVAQNGFISPAYRQGQPPGPYADNALWDLGSSQLVAFNTSFAEYTIELWQQNLVKSSAELADQTIYKREWLSLPVYVTPQVLICGIPETSGERLAQSFPWTVQTYQLRLDNSRVFFFWLRDSNSDNRVTSSYFNITIPSASSTSSTTASTSTGTVSSASPSPPVFSPTAEPPSSGTTQAGLSSGAAAGIGVGASLAGVAIIASILFLLFRRRNKTRQSAQAFESAPAYTGLSNDKSGLSTSPYPPSSTPHTPVAELAHEQRRSPVEMSTERM